MKLNPGAKLLWAEIFNYERMSKENKAFPGLRRLADDLGTDKNSIARWIDMLIEKDLVEVLKRHGRTTVYKTKIPKDWPLIDCPQYRDSSDNYAVHDNGTHCPENRDTTVHDNGTNVETNEIDLKEGGCDETPLGNLAADADKSPATPSPDFDFSSLYEPGTKTLKDTP